eukprot:jgi/Tetstr1/444553/TSEL_000283.t1
MLAIVNLFLLDEPPGIDGYSLRVCGNHAAIGWWDPVLAPPLDPRRGGKWAGQLQLLPGQSFELKFVAVKVSPDGTSSALWEPGCARALEVPNRAKAMQLICHWGAPSRMEVVLEAPRFEREIAGMLLQAPPPPGGVVLAGSSILRLWGSAARDLAPLPVANRAFGGSTTAEQLERMAQIVLPLAPRVVLYYCGSNDIAAGMAAPVIAANFFEFSRRLQLSCRGAAIVYVSIIKSPDKTGKFDMVDHANKLIQQFCDSHPECHAFLDVNPALMEADAGGRASHIDPPAGTSACHSMFDNDMLHLLPGTYTERLAPLVLPALSRWWHTATTDDARSLPLATIRSSRL